jgi:DNA-binding NtrC family response regulator
MCEISKASNFHEAKGFLESRYFDLAILDIMGVDGYKLLEIANKRNVIAIMLTAHAVSPDHIVRSFKEGAALYIPKEKMGSIVTLLNDVLEAKGKGKSTWSRWIDRLASYFDKRFGPDWQDKNKELREIFKYWI